MQTIYIGRAGSNVAGLYCTVENLVNQLGRVLSGSVVGADEAVKYANLQMAEHLWGGENKFTYMPSGGGATWNGTGVDDMLAYNHTQVGRDPEWWEYLIPGWNLWAGIGMAFIDISDSQVAEKSLGGSQNVLGVFHSFGCSGWLHDDPADQTTLDLSAFIQAWFTYFMQYMHGLGTSEANELTVKWNDIKSNSNFANKDNSANFQFTFVQNTVSENEALVSNFYDTLFNQICMSGWTQNDQVEKDSSYLKEMLQTGMMYLTSMADDCFFYQNNYATNSFIKEVADEAAIAAAESKYTTEKARINAKEQELDLKMKNLDTEISSLETEYEAVKKVIEGNVSKSFTRSDG